MNRLWWLSFCDTRQPRGHQFLGALLIEAPTPGEAMRAAWALKLNPGGEVAFHEVTPERIAKLGRRLDKWRARLLDRDACTALDLELSHGISA